MGYALIPSDGKHQKSTTPNDIQFANMPAPLRNSGFNHIESETEAELIVRYCQSRDTGWKPVTLYELHDFGCPAYKKTGVCHNRSILWHLPLFESLLSGKGYVVPQANDTWALTEEFVDVCKEAVDRNKP